MNKIGREIISLFLHLKEEKRYGVSAVDRWCIHAHLMVHPQSPSSGMIQAGTNLSLLNTICNIWSQNYEV